MKKAVIVLIITLTILNSKFIYTHGFGTHAAHLQKIVELNLPGSYLEIINHPTYKPYFIFGSIFPDIQYAANYKETLIELYQKIEDIEGVEGLTYEINVDQIPDVSVAPYPFGIDTHDDKYAMEFAEYLYVQSALPDPPGQDPGYSSKIDSHNRKIAFALGYYAHLAEDVAAHDFLIPKLTATLNLGDIELIKNSQSFVQDPNAQTEGIIETIVDHYYGNNYTVADNIYWDIWVHFNQLEPTLAQMNPFTWIYNGEMYDPSNYNNEGLNPVLVFFNEVLNDWYNNNPKGLPTGEGGYRKNNSPMSKTGLYQLATVFRFVNRFYPAIAGQPFNGYNRLDEVLADWIGNHLDYSPGVDILIVFAQVMTMFDIFDIRSDIFEGIAYPAALAETNAGLAKDARSLVSIMLADMSEADLLVLTHPELININEYSKLRNSILFTNPQSILDSYSEEYITLGSRIYAEIGPPNKWFTDWSPWHSHSMAWGALSSLNNLIPDIYTTNPNVAVYDAYFKVNGNRITGPQLQQVFENNPIVKVIVELYNTSNVSSQSVTLRVKKDHSSTNYASDVLKASTTFTIDHNPSTYNTTARKVVELQFPVNLAELSGYKGYYFELVSNSNNKVMFSSSFEQYQEQLNLTPNYARLYGTYEEGKWPVSLGLIQDVATVNLTSAQFPEGGGSGGSYKINGILRNSITGYIDDYINLEGIPPAGWVFFKWSDENKDNPRNYRITSTNVELYAIYKGIHLSNDINAYNNNGQRKFIRTYDQQYNTTRFHLVYESMNKVWYERSTDGINWEIMNNGQPIYEGIGKHPSIDALPGTHNVIIVYNKDEWEIEAKYYVDGVFKCDTVVANNNVLNLVTPESKPVIACAYARFLVSWNVSEEIVYRFGQLCTQTLPPGYYFHWYFDYKVVTYSPNTIKNNVTIAAAVRTSDYKSYWLAWDSNQSAIQVVNLKTTDDVNFQESQAFTFDQTGFSKNYKPSIIVWKNGNETYDRVRVNWLAFRKTYQTDNPPGGGEQSLGETKVFFRSYDDGVWSPYNSYGVNVTSVNINKNIDNSFAFAWSEGDGIVNKFIRSDNLTNIRTQNTNGKSLQVGNYANLNSMRLMSFKTSTLPYYFLLSNAFNWIPPQQIEPPITDREGVITKDTTSLYFSVGEITVDGEKINFVALPDTSVVNGSEALNTYLISEPFNLTENTFFTYGVQYGVTDSLSAAMTLTEGKSVNFRVELMDEQTNEVLGTFDDVTFSEGSIIPYESIAYQVNTEGIGNRICRLRLVIDDNLNPDYSLTNDYNGEAVLSKQGFVERTLTINEIVKTYELEQNYPNPFNPSTIIKYQIPKDGTVTLKVYDILGSEVATLVNEQKVTGKYEVNFNASKFASGVYIYRLSVNDFVNVKKMVLLK